jgi:transcriptional regulator with XRE-family HTH domain
MSEALKALRAQKFKLVDELAGLLPGRDAEARKEVKGLIADIDRQIASHLQPDGAAATSPPIAEPPPKAEIPPPAPKITQPKKEEPMHQIRNSPTVEPLDYKAIGQRLKEARVKSGWPGTDLAEAAGIKRQSFFDACGGRKSQPVIDGLIAFLHLNRQWLEMGEGEMFESPPPEPPAGKKARRSRKGGENHALANSLKSDGFFGGRRRKSAAPGSLLDAIQRAGRAAQALEHAQAELDQALADLDRIRK